VDGKLLSQVEYQEHQKQVLPGPADLKVLEPIFKARNWMAAGTA
jgi:hypothetical protein